VSREVLLPLFEDVVMLEPVMGLLEEGMRSAEGGEWRDLKLGEADKGREKRAWFVRGGLQGFDPRHPTRGGEGVGVVGEARGGESGGFGQGDGGMMYDA